LRNKKDNEELRVVRYVYNVTPYVLNFDIEVAKFKLKILKIIIVIA
jgi:hypothetical protein